MGLRARPRALLVDLVILFIHSFIPPAVTPPPLDTLEGRGLRALSAEDTCEVYPPSRHPTHHDSVELWNDVTVTADPRARQR